MGKKAIIMIRVMTFNLRFENPGDKDNPWEQRKHMVVDLIQTYKPHILGTQEGKLRQLSFLQRALPGYKTRMPARTLDPISQYPTLFVLEQDLEILEAKEFWLSHSPSQHLSKDWDSQFPRMLSFAKLRHISSQKTFVTGVTHLDHQGKVARKEQANLLVKWAMQQQLPIILAGDFNEPPGDTVHQTLCLPNGPLIDTWQALGLKEDPDSFTYHGFEGLGKGARIDWILVSKGINVYDAKIIKDNKGGKYPSDHFPYMVTLGL